MHTTNYYNTFISVSEDCPVLESEVPKQRGEQRSVALLQFEMVSRNPYRYTSDEVLFQIHALRNKLNPSQSEKERYFSKGHPCFRASPLVKRYGWGIHFDEKGRMALYNMDSTDYQKLKSDVSLSQLSGIRNKRK